MPSTLKPRNDVAVACDDYRSTLRNLSKGSKIKLVNTATGAVLASTTVQ